MQTARSPKPVGTFEVGGRVMGVVEGGGGSGSAKGKKTKINVLHGILNIL